MPLPQPEAVVSGFFVVSRIPEAMRYVGGGYIRNPVTRASQSRGGGRIPRAGWLKESGIVRCEDMAPNSTERTVDVDHGKAVLCSNIHQTAPMNWNKRDVDKLKKKAAKRQAVQRFNKMSTNEIAEKIKTQDDFLKSEEWFILKAKTIAKYGCQCMKCKKTIKQWSGINVDHIKPRKFFPDLKNDPDNLQILCGTCNKNKGNSVADYR